MFAFNLAVRLLMHQLTVFASLPRCFNYSLLPLQRHTFHFASPRPSITSPAATRLCILMYQVCSLPPFSNPSLALIKLVLSMSSLQITTAFCLCLYFSFCPAPKATVAIPYCSGISRFASAFLADLIQFLRPTLDMPSQPTHASADDFPLPLGFRV